MAEPVQSYKKHARWLPAYHFFVMPVLLLNVANAIRHVWLLSTLGMVFQLVVAVALLMLGFLARIMALTVQDRVIRLEMRLRLHELLSPDLRPRINDLTHRQLVAMRFASDAGAARAGTRGPRRQARHLERDQTARQELAGRLAARVEEPATGYFSTREGISAGETSAARPVPGRQLVDVDPTDRTLLELDGVARADQPRRELADARLVADDADARLPGVLLEIGEDHRLGAAGRERLDDDDRRPRIETGGDNLRGLLRTHQRTGQDDVEDHVEAREPADRLPQPRHPLFVQRPLRVSRATPRRVPRRRRDE